MFYNIIKDSYFLSYINNILSLLNVDEIHKSIYKRIIFFPINKLSRINILCQESKVAFGSRYVFNRSIFRIWIISFQPIKLFKEDFHTLLWSE